jgi:hypothetical protein
MVLSLFSVTQQSIMTERVPRLLPPSAEYMTPPPDSPRKRRLLLRESEDSGEDMSIEEYIYCCDSYRSTTVLNPTPYPLLIRPVLECLAFTQAIRQDVLEILREYGFSDESELSIDEVTKPNYPGGSILLATVPYRFGEPRDAVYRLLCAHNMRHLGVEMVRYDRCFRPSLFAIDLTHPAVAKWDNVKKHALQLISEKLGSSWNFLSLFGLGQSEAVALLTTVVMVNPGVTYNWAGLEAAINSLGTRLFVEFPPRSVTLSPSPPPDNANNTEKGAPRRLFS